MKAAFSMGLALALIAVSCGGGGEPLTDEAYFAALQGTFDRAQAAMLTSTEVFQGIVDAADATAEASDAAYLALHRANRDAFEAQRAALAGLTPPEGLAGAHGEMLQALAAIVAALDGALASLLEAPTATVINTALETAGVPQANDRVMTACRAFKSAAADGGIEITLPC